LVDNENLDWLMLDEPDEDNAEQYLDFSVGIVGPEIAGRATQPYAEGVFKLRIKLSPVYGSPGFPESTPPEVSFTTKIWHPLVDAATNKMCSEALVDLWPKYKPGGDAPPEEAKMQPLLAVFRMIQDFMRNVHELAASDRAVNTEAQLDCTLEGGAVFDKKARGFTDKYAVEK
jgi:ubiquitin-protein ligase